MTVRSITATTVETFHADVVDASMRRPVLAIFWVSTSGRIRYQAYIRTYQKLAQAGGDIKLVHMDVAAVASGPGSCGWNPEAIERLGIYAVPTVLAYVGGVAVRSLLGEQPEDKVSDFIARVVTMARNFQRGLPASERRSDAAGLCLSLRLERAKERQGSWSERVFAARAAADATKLGMTADEFRIILHRVGLTFRTAPEFLDIDARTLRRYAVGKIPKPVAKLLRLMARLGENPRYFCTGQRMRADEYRAALDRLNLSAAKAADLLLGIDDRMSQRYAAGDAEIPEVIAKILRLMVARRLSPSDATDLTSTSVAN
jgi:hypothetical protein